MASGTVIGVENVQISVARTNIFGKILNSPQIFFVLAILLIVIVSLFLLVKRFERYERIREQKHILKLAKPAEKKVFRGTRNKQNPRVLSVSKNSRRIFAHPKDFSVKRHKKHR